MALNPARREYHGALSLMIASVLIVIFLTATIVYQYSQKPVPSPTEPSTQAHAPSSPQISRDISFEEQARQLRQSFTFEGVAYERYVATLELFDQTSDVMTFTLADGSRYTGTVDEDALFARADISYDRMDLLTNVAYTSIDRAVFFQEAVDQSVIIITTPDDLTSTANISIEEIALVDL